MSIQEIFVKENENLIYKLIDLNIDFEENGKDLESISEKLYNNQVGYLQFKDKDENLFKIYILPKIFREPKSEIEKKEIKEKFSKYLQLTFSLVNKHGSKLKIKEFKHIETFLDKYKKRIAGLIDFEELLYLKYELSLKQTLKFFRKHKAYIIERRVYSSQSLKYKLDLKRNIKEVNKAKIHQIKKETLIYSKLAQISYQILNSFEERILKNFDKNAQKKLNNISIEVKNFLNRKYKAYTTKKADIKEMLSNRIRALFEGHEEKRLYSYLLTLLGIEIIEGENNDIYIFPNVPTFFISPEKVYEVFVYDWLKNKSEKNTKIKIEFQGEEKFYLKSCNKEIEKKSKPDIIIHKEEKLILIDCKWKIIEKTGDISDEDILKLERDRRVWSKVKTKIIPILIYPVVEINNRKLNVQFSQNDCFKFYIIQKGINLEKN